MSRPWMALIFAVSSAVLGGCSSQPRDPVEALGTGAGNVSSLVLKSLSGTRDGERLDVRATFGDSSRTLEVRLNVNVTPPARLVAGTWNGLASQGSVRERSLTFLGGQAGAPSVGGTFDLIGQQNQTLYRVTIPLQELKQPLGRTLME